MVFSTFCLALVIYTEARGEPIDGQLLVAEVVLNRVQMERYPDNVCEVAFDHKQFSGLNKTPDLQGVFNDPAWEVSVGVAEESLEGATLSVGATHFHATGKTPYWASHMELLGQYGNHIFYRETHND